MPVTGIVIDTGGVESIVSQPIDSEELPIAFAERTLIDQLSFTAVPGDFMGIIGTSGSGKSSLIKALSNSSHCYTGTVKLNNVDITPISEDDSKNCLAYHSSNILEKIT
ncbi:ATP-binding cassette domain-containing protein [Salmonella enterica subsp. enterica serovar Blukwa]|nr:ATP-binding cassette domain-containing protein [Salmonella enterica subsp. enterica serovar Blukwa]